MSASVRYLGGCVLLVAAACGEVARTSPDAQDDSPIDATANATLTVTLDGDGGGAVTSAPAGIDCGDDCDQTFADGTAVSLTAVADGGSIFAGWTGGGCTGTGPCVVTIDGVAVTVTATFMVDVDQHELTVQASGGGTVLSSPAGINCPGACSAWFAAGTSVQLTATAAEGAVFTGWSGGGCSGDGNCAVLITAAATVTAAFACTGTRTFNYTGAAQSFTVPACATAIVVSAHGAQGGTGDAAGGLGGFARATVPVTGGEVLGVHVGGAGATTTGTAAGGYNGGGSAIDAAGTAASGTGGGGSDVRRGAALSGRLVVAGGGGGGGWQSFSGGSGGGVNGGDGTDQSATFTGGDGGTQSAGGAVGWRRDDYPNQPGSFGIGGDCYHDGAGCGAGGGGWYGGGTGGFAGGGGGSGYVNAAGNTAGTMSNGVRAGHGQVTITW